MSAISAELDGDVLTITFFRPEAANAFDLEAAKTLREILKSHRGVRVLVWRAMGRCFCSGGDLHAYARLKGRNQGLLVNRQIAKILGELAAYPAATLAIVEGDCWGGGVELLSCFDTVWSVPDAAFGLWQRRIGLTYGWGGWRRLAARMGEARLRERALAGQAFTAFCARQWGLVDEVIPRFALEDRLKEWRRNQLRLPAEPVAAIKSVTGATEAGWFKKLWGNRTHARILAEFGGGRA
jgi:enoyl-CoA hydratase